jgi:hypothetical protein
LPKLNDTVCNSIVFVWADEAIMIKTSFLAQSNLFSLKTMLMLVGWNLFWKVRSLNTCGHISSHMCPYLPFAEWSWDYMLTLAFSYFDEWMWISIYVLLMDDLHYYYIVLSNLG